MDVKLLRRILPSHDASAVKRKPNEHKGPENGDLAGGNVHSFLSTGVGLST